MPSVGTADASREAITGTGEESQMGEESFLKPPAITGTWKRQLDAKQHRKKHMADGSRVTRGRTCGKYTGISREIHIP